MNRTLGKRHLRTAQQTLHSASMDIWILEESIAETLTRSDIDETTRDYLDQTAAISGDDLARINAFESADPNIKPIGQQRGLWSDVRRHSEAVAA